MRNIFFSLFLLLVVLPSAAATLEPGTWYAITIDGKGINIPNGATADRTALALWTQTNVPSQLWRYTVNDDGTATFQEGYMNYFLCYSAGTRREGTTIVARSEGTKSSYGNWLLSAVDAAAGTYRLTTTDGAYCVGVTAVADDAAVVLREAATAEAALTTWTFTPYDGEVPTYYNEVARDAIFDGFMGHYYHSTSSGYVLGAGGWWGDAEMIETILDTFETTGEKTYQTYAQRLITNFLTRNGADWTYNAYNDDITWMVLAAIRAYKYFGSAAYLSYAKDNYDKMYARALESDGALRWCEDSQYRSGSNSCINCPAVIAACYLYELTADAAYLDKAQSTYAFQRAHLYNASTGQVYDSGSWDAAATTFTVGNEWASTYNQGTMLGAATKLYRLTGDDQYRADAVNIYTYAYDNLTNSDKIINVCQTATGDLCGFKGILMRYVRLFAQTVGEEEPLRWMEKNAWYALQKANSAGVIWSKWLTKTPEDFMDGADDFSNDAFGASTAVSVAFNAHVNRLFTKDAYDYIYAQYFDDIQFMQLSATHDDDADSANTTAATDGYIAFTNVVFGSTSATAALLRAATTGATGSVHIYLDTISPAMLIGTVPVSATTWDTYTIDITPTTGTHTVYLVPAGDGGVQMRFLRFTNSSDGIQPLARQQERPAPQGTYNLLGQALPHTMKGINIVNGKKVVAPLSAER